MAEITSMLLWCPSCSTRHVDAGEFIEKPHHTHACQSCGMVWRPAIGPTRGVQFLPGFKDEPRTTEAGSLFFGNRQPPGSTGTRFALRYKIVDGSLVYEDEDVEAIGDALVAAYAGPSHPETGEHLREGCIGCDHPITLWKCTHLVPREAPED